MIVVHLQTLLAVPPLHLLLILLLRLAAFAAAAASPPAEPEHGLHHGVPRLHRVKRTRKELPAPQYPRQETFTSRLHHVYDDYEYHQRHDGNADAHQDLPSSQREAEDAQRKHQEAEDEVDSSEPAVLSRVVPQAAGQADGNTREGDRVPEHDPHDVEEEVAQSDLEETNQSCGLRGNIRTLL